MPSFIPLVPTTNPSVIRTPAVADRSPPNNTGKCCQEDFLSNGCRDSRIASFVLELRSSARGGFSQLRRPSQHRSFYRHNSTSGGPITPGLSCDMMSGRLPFRWMSRQRNRLVDFQVTIDGARRVQPPPSVTTPIAKAAVRDNTDRYSDERRRLVDWCCKAVCPPYCTGSM